MQGSNNSLGRYGEEVAARWLAADGLKILERNWRCAEGELDIIALDGDTLAVCEVKTRSERGFQQPSQGIDQSKAERLRRLAERWLGERWPTHFAKLAQEAIRGTQGVGVEPADADTDAAEADAADSDAAATHAVGAEPGADPVDPAPPWPAPPPPGGVRIDLVAVINRVKGAAQVEYLRGAV